MKIQHIRRLTYIKKQVVAALGFSLTVPSVFNLDAKLS